MVCCSRSSRRGRKNGNSFEWDERRGINILEGLDESLPIIGVKFEYSWTYQPSK
jgi:hypothetical protein